MIISVESFRAGIRRKAHRRCLQSIEDEGDSAGFFYGVLMFGQKIEIKECSTVELHYQQI